MPIPDSVEGQSFVPALSNPEAQPKDFALSVQSSNANGFSIRTARYRLVRWGNSASPSQIDLFDYQTDPDGKRNAAGENPDVVADLLNRISEL